MNDNVFYVAVVFMVMSVAYLLLFNKLSQSSRTTDHIACSAVGGIYKHLGDAGFLCLSPDALKEIEK